MMRLFTSALALCAFCQITPAAAVDLTYKNDSGGTVKAYGMLHPVVTVVDDGDETETNLLDHSLANSRLGLRATQPWGDNEAGFWFETGLSLPNTGQADQFGVHEDGWDREDLRHVDFYLKNDDWGKLSLGQGSMTSDGAAEVSLSYVSTTLYSNVGQNSGFFLRQDDGVLSGRKLGSTASHFDGARRGRVRYDTPVYGGFSASFAYGQNILNSSDDDDYYDARLSYGDEFAGGTRVKAAVAYAFRDFDNGSGEQGDILGSASAILPNGLSFTVAAGTRDDDRGGAPDPVYGYGQIAYENDWFSWGKTGFGVDYYRGEDFGSDGSETDIFGVAAIQRIDSLNLDTYVKFRTHGFDEDSTDYEDINAWTVGARWKF